MFNMFIFKFIFKLCFLLIFCLNIFCKGGEISVFGLIDIICWFFFGVVRFEFEMLCSIIGFNVFGVGNWREFVEFEFYGVVLLGVF